FACHGALKQEAELRVDTAALMRKGSYTGPVIEPGKVEESYLIDVLTGDAGFRMPPEGEPLSGEQIAAIKGWIAAGAPAPADEAPQKDPMEHWAFQPPTRPEVPTVRDAAWSRN